MFQFSDFQNFSKEAFKFDFRKAKIDFALEMDDPALLRDSLAGETYEKGEN